MLRSQPLCCAVRKPIPLPTGQATIAYSRTPIAALQDFHRDLGSFTDKYSNGNDIEN